MTSDFGALYLLQGQVQSFTCSSQWTYWWAQLCAIMLMGRDWPSHVFYFLPPLATRTSLQSHQRVPQPIRLVRATPSNSLPRPLPSPVFVCASMYCGLTCSVLYLIWLSCTPLLLQLSLARERWMFLFRNASSSHFTFSCFLCHRHILKIVYETL